MGLELALFPFSIINIFSLVLIVHVLSAANDTTTCIYSFTVYI